MVSNGCKFIFVSLVFVIASSYSQAQTADDVISKYLEFIGGETKWKEVKSIVTSGEYNYGGVAFPFKAYSKAPNQYKFMVTFNGKYYAQAFDGKSGWKIDVFNGETSPTLLKDNAAIAMANEANVELEDPFVGYKEKGHQVSLEGKDTAAGRSCYKIKLTRKNGESETCYFDEKTSELVMKQATAKNPELGGALLITLYSDYRKVNDIRIPFRSVAKTVDQTILTITISKAELNVAIEDTEFQPSSIK